MAGVISKTIKTIGNGLYSFQSSGTTTINVSYNSTYAWQVHELRMHMTTAAEASTFIAAINSSGGVSHDLELVRENMNAVKDLYYQPTRPIRMSVGDSLEVDWIDATTHKWGLEVVFEKLQ